MPLGALTIDEIRSKEKFYMVQGLNALQNGKIGAVLLAVLPPLLGMGMFSVWVARALTFLVISCPCALVISIPLSFFGGIGGASKRGILVKGSNYLEALAQTETVVFDKSATRT